MATPSGTSTKQQLKVTRGFFDFDEFETVTAGKLVDFTPLPNEATMEQMLSICGNDMKKMRDLLNEGLKSATRDAGYYSDSGWYQLDEKKNVSATPYEGGADASDVNEMKRTIARTVYAYDPADTAEQKKAKMQQALDFIKGNPGIREGLKAAASKH